MSEPIKCSECGGVIADSEAVWHRPFAGATRDRDGVLTTEPEVSTSDNGGLPFHRMCLPQHVRDLLPNQT